MGDAEQERAPDVIVIGGGIIGCSIALRLGQARLRVLVLDRGEPGEEASAAAAGMLAPQGETTDPDDFFGFCFKSRQLYPQFVAEVESLSGIRVNYRAEGTLLLATDGEEARELERVFQAQKSASLALERLDKKEVTERLPGAASEVESGIFIPGDHWLDNERLMRALVEAARRSGARFSSGITVTGFRIRQGRIESVLAARTSASGHMEMAAGHFVLAAGCWSGPLAANLGLALRTEPCRGQMIEFEYSQPLPLVVRHGHYYMVPRNGNRIIAGTTAEYTGYEKVVTAAGLRSIIAGVGRLASWVAELRFRRAWAGLRPDTADHRPILGHAVWPNLTFATGHFRNGILLAPLTAQVIAELILAGKSSENIEAYRPERFTG